jgi:hypothetical protein
MNASTFEQASDIDYFITNVDSSTATAEWIVTTYSQRNWAEVFYRKRRDGWGFMNIKSEFLLFVGYLLL